MIIGDRLSSEQKQQLNKMARPKEQPKAETSSKPKTKQKKQEDFSFRELERMMGRFRDTYTRRNGAIKRK